jgi:hypothetical protein
MILDSGGATHDPSTSPVNTPVSQILLLPEIEMVWSGWEKSPVSFPPEDITCASS